ncbi:LysR family transcriptional regulator [Variovorax sp. PCZ-1]|uniref:LysR family transcriptional regulator n=1 Tax=Variovorax sp. PCZ-1 TaxID=2835533 RepID=UPI001BCC2F1D|nr:LysR family transcriptional regulator [Variovorax sp. PCZ-1]MBS7806619.1 LysR family transcriptional regulator [Variovorax sp. PCZ-1]
MDSLALIRTFREVAHRGSFSDAAKVLGTSKANASKYVSALEEVFGVRLLHRSTRNVSLTDAGALLLERSEPLLDMVNSTREDLLSMAAQPSGRLRMSVVSSLGDGEFTALLAEFAKLHPKVHLSMEYTNRRVDLVDEAVDLAIRVGRLTDSDLIVRKLRPISFALAASPAYWKMHGKPNTPHDMANHQCLIYTQENSNRSGHSQWLFESSPGQTYAVNVRGNFDATDGRAHRLFALAGQGVTYLPLQIIEDDIDQGTLETALDDHLPSDIWLMAVYTQRRHNSAALRALLDFLQARLQTS